MNFSSGWGAIVENPMSMYYNRKWIDSDSTDVDVSTNFTAKVARQLSSLVYAEKPER
jgi:hypothetical protein